MKTFLSARSRSYRGSPRPVLYGLLALLTVAFASEPAADLDAPMFVNLPLEEVDRAEEVLPDKEAEIVLYCMNTM